jgi:DNA-binding PadR family transcriptional regulator
MPKQKLDPLPSAAFQILVSLADRDLHGYGIMRQVEQETGGRRRLGPGTLLRKWIRVANWRPPMSGGDITV